MKKIIGLMSSFMIFGSIYALNPVREYARTPADVNMEYEEFTHETSDGATIYGWYFKNPYKVVKKYIIVGDDDSGNMADNLEIVQMLLQAGYNVMTFDYRGFGKSSDFDIDPKNYIYSEFIKDMEAVIDWGRKHNKGTTYDLYGMGMGAGIAIGIGGNRTEVLRVIADSPFMTLEQIKTKLRINNESVNVPFNYARQYEPLYVFEKPQPKLRGILFIYGTNDELVGKDEIKEFKTVGKKYLTFYEVHGAVSHKETFMKDKEAYLKEVQNFLKKTDE